MQSLWSPSWIESPWEWLKVDSQHLVVADADEEINKQVHEIAILARATHMHVPTYDQ